MGVFVSSVWTVKSGAGSPTFNVPLRASVHIVSNGKRKYAGIGIPAMTCPKASGGWRMDQPINPTKPSQRQKRTVNVPTNSRFVVFFIAIRLNSLGHRIHFEIPLWRNAKCISDTIEEREHGGDIHRFGNLRFGPAMITKNL